MVDSRTWLAPSVFPIRARDSVPRVPGLPIYRPPDPPPHAVALAIAAVEHQIFQPRGFKLRVLAALADQQVGRAPNVEI